ncbi:DNA adenine methylase [Aneurinibacillus danicus]|jgi:DNA adenine methylase|uniref:Site-specific DNA-methyltransferase (adenine-specific) n=1 Tax=Aneurinibacillus danicus TaxID=267746 RepID=A0A511VCC9_9BACL|nr:DNA adenine methylase [Aneurinibacillus danicus]GEN36489.1 site-specific DNA-methyltransferase (adenine-specific) [Aneurinibacillus danicus]
MYRKEDLRPVLKWAGGKRQLLADIAAHMPADYELNEHAYFEPFFGGGAVLFHFAPRRAYINDVNAELMRLYRTIKEQPEALIEQLREHRNESEYFYEVRAWDRSPEFSSLSDAQKSARMIFLNRTCFNGLHRVNSKGYFNVPFGKYKNPDIVQEDAIRAISGYLRSNDIIMSAGDFSEQVLEHAQTGDFVYFDPPYDPVSETAAFTAYATDGFTRDDQLRLRDVYRQLSDRGCFVMLSNSSTDFIRNIYQEFNVCTIHARRNINSKGTGRGKVDEVLVLNYKNIKGYEASEQPDSAAVRNE